MARLDLEDNEAAQVAFEQASLHLRDRARTLGGGFLLVQALVGLSRATGRPEYREEARQLLEERPSYDFSFFWTCTESQCSRDFDLAHAR